MTAGHHLTSNAPAADEETTWKFGIGEPARRRRIKGFVETQCP